MQAHTMSPLPLPPQSLADVLVGVAGFSAACRKRPSSTWLRFMATRLQELAGSVTQQQLADALPALVALQLVPSQQWLEDMEAAVAGLQVEAGERAALEQQLVLLRGSAAARLGAGAGAVQQQVAAAAGQQAVPAVVYA
jgi:hypothetical protein